MPELEILKNRVDGLETDVKEVKSLVGDIEDRTIALSDRAYALEFWRNGNGSKGAEARLQNAEACVEKFKELHAAPVPEELIKHIADTAAKSIVQNAKTRDMTIVAKVKAFAPYFAAFCGLAAGIIAALW